MRVHVFFSPFLLISDYYYSNWYELPAAISIALIGEWDRGPLLPWVTFDCVAFL